MAQGVLSFQYEREKGEAGMTALGGLPVYLDLGQVMGVRKSIEKHLGVRVGEQGWRDDQLVLSMILLNISGGDCVEDLGRMEGDEGFCRALRRVELDGMSRRERREEARRWRKERRRTVPSPSAGFRYLEVFHDPAQEKLKVSGKAFIPQPNQYLQGFPKVNRDMLAFMQSRNPQTVATLDMDAVLVETNKTEAFYCYKGYKSYQPLSIWWAEQEMLLYTEFRDGNVPAGYEQVRVLEAALAHLPEGVEQVRLRVDTAGYEHVLLRYCEEGKNERFGRIEFAIGVDVTPEFKKAVAEVPEGDWKPIRKKVRDKLVNTGQEWAEVCFVPNAIAHKKQGLEYRYLAIREALPQLTLPGIQTQMELPFQTMKMGAYDYKVFGTVTNMSWDGEAVIHWQRGRCGKSEEAHSVMKEDLAGGKLPSGKFGVNAAWWWIMVLALNLNQAMKQLILGKNWATKRLKAIRFALINLPARVMEHARRLIIRLSRNHPSFDWLLQIRARIAELAPVPSG